MFLIRSKNFVNHGLEVLIKKSFYIKKKKLYTISTGKVALSGRASLRVTALRLAKCTGLYCRIAGPGLEIGLLYSHGVSPYPGV